VKPQLHSDACSYPLYSIGDRVHALTGGEVTTCPGCQRAVIVYRGVIVVDEPEAVGETMKG
jgi:hypothetical protein